MATRGRVQAIITASVIVWAALLFLQGVDLRLSYLRPYSLVVGIVLILSYAFDKWLWRLLPFPRLLGRPVLAGTWKGELRSNWIDQQTGEAADPILVFLLIRQTYAAISIRLFTANSFSKSETAEIHKSPDGVSEIVMTYQNIPLLHLREQSPLHYGAMRLQIHGRPTSRLEGAYWTDRDTKGEVVFTAHVLKAYSDFAAASMAMLDTPSGAV